MQQRPPHGGYADMELGGDTPPPVASLFAPRRLHALELKYDFEANPERVRHLDRKREAERTAAAVQRNREISEAAAVARREGFERGREHQRAVARHDRWYWLAIGLFAGMALTSVALWLDRQVGALL